MDLRIIQEEAGLAAPRAEIRQSYRVVPLMATKLCLYLCFSVLGCIAILQCYVDCADPRQNVDRYFGPYKDIYPFVDITQDQLKCSIRENGTCPLYIGLMMSFGGEFDSSGVIPGVQLALDQINSDPTTLPGYTLHYTLRDTIVSEAFT